MEELREIIETIDSLLEEHNYWAIKELIKDMEPADLSLVFAEFPKKTATLFRLLPKDLASETFVEMESDTQEALLNGFTDNEIKSVLEELYIDDTVDIIEEMPANVVKRMLHNSDAESRKIIN